MSFSKKGFTLIELLVVIAIIAIVAAVVLASINESRIKSRNTSTVANIDQIIKGLELYHTNYGEYPDSTGWDCILGDTDNDNRCWANSIRYTGSGGNHAELTILNDEYINFLSMPSYTDGGIVEGAIYQHVPSDNGYIIWYVLEGIDQACPLGRLHSGNLTVGGFTTIESGNTACKYCHNTTASICAS